MHKSDWPCRLTNHVLRVSRKFIRKAKCACGTQPHIKECVSPTQNIAMNLVITVHYYLSLCKTTTLRKSK